MPALIVLLFPAIVMVVWDRLINKRKFSLKAVLLEYLAGAVAVNGLAIAVVFLVFGSGGNVVSNINTYPSYALKYLLLSLLFALLLPYVARWAVSLLRGRNGEMEDLQNGIQDTARVPFLNKYAQGRLSTALERVGTVAIRVLSGITLAILLAGSWTMTAYIDDGEHLYLLPDHVIWHLALLAVLTVLFIAIKKKQAWNGNKCRNKCRNKCGDVDGDNSEDTGRDTDRDTGSGSADEKGGGSGSGKGRHPRRIRDEVVVRIKRCGVLQRIREVIPYHRPYLLLLILALVTAAGIVILQLDPVSDQYWVSEAAAQILNGDFSSFSTGEYMDRCPHQKGIVVLLALIYRVAGLRNYLVVELLNLLAAAAICLLLYHLTPARYRHVTMIVLVLFFPMWMYTTFVYGTLFGLAFALLSIWAFEKFRGGGKSAWMVLCVAAAFAAVVCKSNYLIFVVGLILLFAVEILLKHRHTLLLPLAVLLCLLFVKEDLLNQAIYAISDAQDYRVEETRGHPTLGYVVMGLRDESSLSEGWYDLYVWDLYADAGYDREAASLQAREDLAGRLAAFTEDPVYTARFFLKKTLTQWCEPTFQSLWLLEQESPADADNPLHQWLIRYQDDGVVFRDVYIGYMNLFQSFIYLGAFLYVLSYENKRGMFPLWGLLIFFGGFLFHLFWEAKSQYTWVYFMLLIPYAVEGIRWFMERCLIQYDAIREKKGTEGV